MSHIATTERRGRGRPFENRVVVRRVKLTPEEDADLRRRAEAKGVKVSTYVRTKLFG